MVTEEMINYSHNKNISLVFKRNVLLMFLLSMVLVSGCTGLQTFSQSAYPGDTVGMAIGRQDVKLGQTSIIITDSNSVVHTFLATDPKIRAWFNVYPEPVSRMVVGRETGLSLNTNAWVWGVAAEVITGVNERDFYDTIVMMDLPTSLAPGVANIDIQVASTSILPGLIEVNVLSGTGAANTFDIFEGFIQTATLKSMGRGKHYTISFSGATVPAAIQLDLTHDPDRDNGGVGQAYVVAPRGDIMNPTWTDDGTAMRVILTNSWQKSAEDLARDPDFDTAPVMSWFKIYVAGDVTGLVVNTVSAFDVNGDTVSGVTATIQ